MKFAMYGSGGAGSVFASYLRRGGADIILIDRYAEHMRKVAADDAASRVRTNLAEYLEKGLVK